VASLRIGQEIGDRFWGLVAVEFKPNNAFARAHVD
jgi:hypothetical protein